MGVKLFWGGEVILLRSCGDCPIHNSKCWGWEGEVIHPYDLTWRVDQVPQGIWMEVGVGLGLSITISYRRGSGWPPWVSGQGWGGVGLSLKESCLPTT